MRNRTIVLFLISLLALPALAFAQGTKFEAGAGPSEKGAPTTLEGCQTELETCVEHKDGTPYLYAAYLGLWVVLIVFLFMIDQGQRKLEAELVELKARHRRLEAQGGGSS